MYSITSKVHTHSFQGYKRYVKNVILNNYCDICLIRICYVCKFSKYSDTCEVVIHVLLAMMYYIDVLYMCIRTESVIHIGSVRVV